MNAAATLPARAITGADHRSTAMGSQAAKGAAWTIGFSLLGKLLALISQFALAWILVPDQLGLVGLTLALMSFTAVVGGANLKNVLVQRSAEFQANAGQLFWFALLLNSLAAFGLAAMAPLAGLLFHEPRIVALLLVASLAIPIQSLSTIYLAALHCELRFGRVAGILFGASLLQNVSAVLLALRGWGALAIILPLLGNAVFMAAAFRIAAGRLTIDRLNLRASLALCGPVGWLVVNGLCLAALNSGANVAIGLVQHDTTAAGYYHWGASLACQAIFLLVTNLQGVFFPVLNRLNDEPERQLAGAMTACRALLAIVAPVCVLQALLAGPLIELIFHQRWQPAVPVVQWLSLGLMTQPLNVLAAALLMARGEFRRLAWVNGFIGVAVFGSALAGASLGDQSIVAAFVGPVLLATNGLAGLWVLRSFGAGWRRLLGMACPPLAAASLAGLVGSLLANALSQHGPLLRLGAVGATVTATAAAATWILLPGLAGDLWLRLRARGGGVPQFPVPAHPAPEPRR